MNPEWAQRLFYSVILFICSGLAGGLAIYGMRKYVGLAISTMNEGLVSVKADLKSKSDDLKDHFEKTCDERRNTCQKHIAEALDKLSVRDEKLAEMDQEQWKAIKDHGHKGLNGDDAKVTF